MINVNSEFAQNFAPTCNRKNWILRQQLMNRVRKFFENRNVLEVETPTISNACGTDPQLDYFEVEGEKYLMTSPEFHMKRLLAAGFGDIFQICKSFRKDEFGAHHNNEFSMVEWYRIGMPQENLMDEVEDLVSEIIGCPIKAKRTRWIDAFKNYAGVDPLAEFAEFEKACIICCEKIGAPKPAGKMSREDWWDYLMVFAVEPVLAKNGPEFILDYPPSQAALAQTYQAEDGVWAKRFELFVNQVELCNGYTELTDAKEQRKRFNDDLELRKGMGKNLPPIDENFLAALESGMPSCSGVALGLDRLFMLALNKSEIKEVILFPSPNA